VGVCDASFLADAFLVDGSLAERALDRLARSRRWHAPHVLPAEVTSVCRRLVGADQVDVGVAAAALDRLERMRLDLHAFAPCRERVWQLRDNATAYDAWYLALAERLGEPLVTTDNKLAQVPGVRCDVEVIGA
jgi:predicted nucleic acid-binding protein